VNFGVRDDRGAATGNNTVGMKQVIFVNQKDVTAREIYPGVRKRVLWHGANGAKAQMLEIDAGATFLKLDVHHPGPAEIYVVSGTFNDGARDYPAGSFVHNPAGSSHLPQSREGCVLFVFFPEG
jgi:anti-sigma factor ChrR (cupin superfamily)